MNSNICAYAAGIIDGEGSIQITKKKDNTVRHGYTFCLTIQVGNNKPELGQWLKDNFGGSFYPGGLTKADNPTWRWALSAKKAEAFICYIFPCLILKRQKAIIALEYRSKMNPGATGYTKEEWNELTRLYEEIRNV